MLEKLPKSFIIRGGGATGVEWASVYHRYGSKVTLVGNVVPQEDARGSASTAPRLPAPEDGRRPGARPTADDIDVGKDGVTMRIKDAKGKERTVEAEVLLVAIGRQGNIEDIGLEEVGVKTEGDYIPVDVMMRTNVPRRLRHRRRQRPADARPHRHAPGHHRRRAHLRPQSVPARCAQLARPAPTASRRSAASV